MGIIDAAAKLPPRVWIALAICIALIVVLVLWVWHLDRVELTAGQRRRELEQARFDARQRAKDDQAARLKALRHQRT